MPSRCNEYTEFDAIGMSLLCRHNFEHNGWGKESGNIPEIIRKFSGKIIMDSVLKS